MTATALLLVLAGLFTHPAVDGGTLDRLGELRAEIDVAADQAGLEPAVLAAVLVGETGVRPLVTDGQHFGIAQMRLFFWRHWLAGAGWHPDDLDDPVWGTVIVGEALAFLRWRHGARDNDELLCDWACGPSRHFRRCAYLGKVRWIAAELRRWGW